VEAEVDPSADVRTLVEFVRGAKRGVILERRGGDLADESD
jgi:hypothetical protein